MTYLWEQTGTIKCNANWGSEWGIAGRDSLRLS